MQLGHGTIDLILFLIANLVNLLIVGVMLSRPLGLKRLEKGIGWVVAALSLPVGLAVVLNALGGRGGRSCCPCSCWCTA